MPDIPNIGLWALSPAPHFTHWAKSVNGLMVGVSIISSSVKLQLSPAGFQNGTLVLSVPFARRIFQMSWAKCERRVGDVARIIAIAWRGFISLDSPCMLLTAIIHCARLRA